jgi:hypothetical protein
MAENRESGLPPLLFLLVPISFSLHKYYNHYLCGNFSFADFDLYSLAPDT